MQIQNKVQKYYQKIYTKNRVKKVTVESYSVEVGIVQSGDTEAEKVKLNHVVLLFLHQLFVERMMCTWYEVS